MDREVQTRLLERAFAHLAAGTTDLAADVMRQPARVYLDPDVAARERAMLRARPLVAAHASELPEPGDFVTAEVVGTPVLVVRQDDGAVRAFSNVCRHRGARVAGEECGTARVFSCPFHAWSYDRDGSLRAITYPAGFAGVDTAGLGLVPLAAEERHGFVWVVPAPGAVTVDVAGHLGPELDADMAAFGLADYVAERSRRFDNDLNWKLVVDGFLEDYHLRFLHAKTVGPYFAPDLHLFDALGPHGRLVPMRRNISEVRHRQPDEVSLLAHAIVLYVIFPATVLLWQADHFELWTVLPDPADPRRSTTTVRLLAHRSVVRSERERWDRNWEILMATVPVEDWVAAAAIQSGLESGTQDHLLFGRNEIALQHFHRSLSASVAR